MFQQCYNLMKTNNDNRQSTVKKYDERVQLVGMDSNNGNTHYHYVVYNYDCKLNVTAFINCQWNDGGEVRWTISMTREIKSINNYKNTLDMWNDNSKFVYTNDDIFDVMSRDTIEIEIDRDDYGKNTLLLGQELKEVVRKTFGLMWYNNAKKHAEQNKTTIIEQYPILYSRYLSSNELMDQSDDNRMYHVNRIDLFYDIVHGCDYEEYNEYQMYLDEMEQEDINTSIRMLF